MQQLFTNKKTNGDSTASVAWKGGVGVMEVRKNAGSGTVTLQYKRPGGSSFLTTNDSQLAVTATAMKIFELPAGDINVNLSGVSGGGDFDAWIGRRGGIKGA